VVFTDSEEWFAFPHRKVKFDKLSFFPDGALGCYYGSQFEVHRQQLVLVQENETQSEGGGSECGHDNREIVDDGSAQALKEGAILKLRAEGRGKEVVGTVVEHSNSFKIKTKFSQEKYINKKRKKHAPVITILKPSTRTLCEMYYSRGPSKICHMRPDTVAQILTYSNIHPHSNMVVMETTQGLLLTAMLERMGGVRGCPCQLVLLSVVPPQDLATWCRFSLATFQSSWQWRTQVIYHSWTSHLSSSTHSTALGLGSLPSCSLLYCLGSGVGLRAPLDPLFLLRDPWKRRNTSEGQRRQQRTQERRG
jgi:hypothetical protein